jgi:predicted alpha/beta-hydrolase family hydrolase
MPALAAPGSLRVTDSVEISTLWLSPPKPTACFVLAHGAGAGMRQAFLESFAAALAARDIATLRYQFPYMERRSRRPDPPPLCHQTVRAAVAEAALRTDAPLVAGGRSFGGRMTSQAQAQSPLPRVTGLAFLGFPLHPAKKPSHERAEHLAAIQIPQLFLQGTRDELAEVTLLRATVAQLGPKATVKWIAEADHSFHVLARSGRTDAMVFDELIAAFCEWVEAVIGV